MSHAHSGRALGETGDWVEHLAVAWQALADPDGRHPVPDRPSDPQLWDRGPIRWWSPMLHLLLYGLGWPRPDAGLARWHEAGRPCDDARLALVERWWGDASAELADWACRSQALRTLCHEVGVATATDQAPGPATEQAVRPPWVPDERRWGHGDPMHLWFHVRSAAAWAADTPGRLVVGNAPTRSEPGSAVLLVDGYAGWYAELHRLGATLPVRDGDRSWRVDVVCTPLGWLGSYRRSRVSGRWFAGRHRTHQLGIL